jgi:Glycosyl hydrolase family 85
MEKGCEVCDKEQRCRSVCAPLHAFTDTLAFCREFRDAKPQSGKALGTKSSSSSMHTESEIFGDTRAPVVLCHDMTDNFHTDRFNSLCRYHLPDAQEPFFCCLDPQTDAPNSDDPPRVFGLVHWHLVSAFIYFAHNRVTIPPEQVVFACARLSKVFRVPMAVFGTFLTEWGDGEREHDRLFDLAQAGAAERASLIAALSRCRTEHSFHGWFINLESRVRQSDLGNLRSFLSDLQVALETGRRGGRDRVLWYDSVCADTGELAWQDAINDRNRDLYTLCGSVFLNYCWDSRLVGSADDGRSIADNDSESPETSPVERPRPLLEDSIKYCEGLDGGDERTVIAGLDVWGRGAFGGGQFHSDRAAAVVTRLREQHSTTSLSIELGVFGPGWTCESSRAHLEGEGSPPESRNSHARSRVWPFLRSMRLWEGWTWSIVSRASTELAFGQSTVVTIPKTLPVGGESYVAVLLCADVYAPGAHRAVMTMYANTGTSPVPKSTICCTGDRWHTLEQWLVLPVGEEQAILVGFSISGASEAAIGAGCVRDLVAAVVRIPVGEWTPDRECTDVGIGPALRCAPLASLPFATSFHVGGLFGGDCFGEGNQNLYHDGTPLVDGENSRRIAAAWIESTAASDVVATSWMLQSLFSVFAAPSLRPNTRYGFARCDSHGPVFVGAQALRCEGFVTPEHRFVLIPLAAVATNGRTFEVEAQIQTDDRTRGSIWQVALAPKESKQSKVEWSPVSSKELSHGGWLRFSGTIETTADAVLIAIRLESQSTAVCHEPLVAHVGSLRAVSSSATASGNQPTLQVANLTWRPSGGGVSLTGELDCDDRVRCIDVLFLHERAGEKDLRWVGRTLGDPCSLTLCFPAAQISSALSANPSTVTPPPITAVECRSLFANSSVDRIVLRSLGHDLQQLDFIELPISSVKVSV